MKLSIVMPFKKEKENLNILIPELIKSLDEIFTIPKNNYEILLVGNILEKETIQNLENTFKNNNLFFIPSINPDSYGNAIRAGIKFAKGERIITMDSDYSHDPKYLKALYKEKDSADIILASRYIKGGINKDFYINIIISRILNLLIRLLFNFHISDITSSLRLYDSKILKSEKYYCDDFEIIEEILIKLLSKNKQLKILEIPYLFKKRKFGKSKRTSIKLIRKFIILFIKLKKSSVN